MNLHLALRLVVRWVTTLPPDEMWHLINVCDMSNDAYTVASASALASLIDLGQQPGQYLHCRRKQRYVITLNHYEMEAFHKVRLSVFLSDKNRAEFDALVLPRLVWAALCWSIPKRDQLLQHIHPADRADPASALAWSGQRPEPIREVMGDPASMPSVHRRYRSKGFKERQFLDRLRYEIVPPARPAASATPTSTPAPAPAPTRSSPRTSIFAGVETAVVDRAKPLIGPDDVVIPDAD